MVVHRCRVIELERIGVWTLDSNLVLNVARLCRLQDCVCNSCRPAPAGDSVDCNLNCWHYKAVAPAYVIINSLSEHPSPRSFQNTGGMVARSETRSRSSPSACHEAQSVTILQNTFFQIPPNFRDLFFQIFSKRSVLENFSRKSGSFP